MTMLDSIRVHTMGDKYLDQYFGVWAIEPTRGSGLAAVAGTLKLTEHRVAHVAALEARTLEAAVEAIQIEGVKAAMGDGGATGPFKGYITTDGVAVIAISGVMMKFVSSLDSGTSTVRVRQQIRAAVQDDRVRGIFLLIDSPGGTVAGTAELGDDVRSAAAKKPVWAYADDMMASAAYWVGSQADRIGANRTAFVGSLGTVFMLYDWSQAFKDAGIKPKIYASGKLKAAGAKGTEITEEQDDYFDSLIAETNSHFIQAVTTRRKQDMKARLEEAAVYVAPKAKDYGLIDEVGTADAFYSQFVQHLNRVKPTTTPRAEDTTQVGATADIPAKEPSALVDDALAVQTPIVELPAQAGEGVDMSTPSTTGANPGAAGGSQPASNPVAATLAQLKAACPGASSDFLVSQLDQNATVEQARDAYMAVLLKDRADAQAAAQANATKPAATPPATPAARPGTTPVGSAASEQTAPSANAFAEFKTAVAAKKATGLSTGQAIVAVAKDNPELHQAVIGRVA